MKVHEPIKRGDVFRVDLSTAIGHEINKIRPCLVISSNGLNAWSSVITVLPLQTLRLKRWPRRDQTIIAPPDGGIRNVSVTSRQLITVDVVRLRGRLGSVSPEIMAKVEATVASVLGLAR